ncbi:hypothetical protein HFP89_06575 [Wenzhouxiangella sp. XN79A]|uniref:hypothetical protein n=1 Tax=Wenzhouxiangella sp. XN79A TaxID=2724193 RepID=UPI00144AC784|nr:hypothetical protein [Wenzhouxiangella sp. XN79A]NKI34827.1 hypothetical protein [Wenzhouxiangella sp. XN79A]
MKLQPWLPAGALLLLSSGLAAQTLVYEREYTLIAEADNTLRVELHPDGRLVVERPEFMTWSGRHEFRVAPSRYQALRDAFDAAHTDTGRLYEDVQRRAANEEWIVTDPEFSRFALVDEARGPLEQVTAVSLEAWAARFDDPRLERLHDLELDLFELMNAQAPGAEQ